MMRTLPLRLTATVLAFVLLAGGCASGGKRSREYVTVPESPNRDTAAADRLTRKATELIERDDLNGAEESLKRALAADVTHGPAHNTLGIVYYRTNRYYLAAWEFQYAARLLPHKPEPRNNLGLVLEAVGRLEEAAETYAEAKDLEPDNPQFIGNLARARIRQGDRSSQTRQLLEEIVMKDTRPEWVEWARRRLALMGRPDDGG